MYYRPRVGAGWICMLGIGILGVLDRNSLLPLCAGGGRGGDDDVDAPEPIAARGGGVGGMLQAGQPATTSIGISKRITW